MQPIRIALNACLAGPQSSLFTSYLANEIARDIEAVRQADEQVEDFTNLNQTMPKLVSSPKVIQEEVVCSPFEEG